MWCRLAWGAREPDCNSIDFAFSFASTYKYILGHLSGIVSQWDGPAIDLEELSRTDVVPKPRPVSVRAWSVRVGVVGAVCVGVLLAVRYIRK